MINIAIWCPPSDFGNLPLPDKVKQVQRLFEDAYTQMKQTGNKGENFYIFLCPEWTFINSLNISNNRSYSRKELQDVVKAFKEFSKSFPDALLVIGSMRVTKEFNLKKSAKYELLFKQARETNVSFSDFIQQNFTKNVALIFFNGQRIRYNKKIDALDVDIGFKGKFYPGAYSNVFQCGNLRIGFEICADHAEAKLKKELQANESVDFHLVISDTIGNKFENIPAANIDSLVLFAHAPAGFYNQSDTASQNVGVWLGNQYLEFKKIKETMVPHQQENLKFYTNIYTSKAQMDLNQFVDIYDDLPELESDMEEKNNKVTEQRIDSKLGNAYERKEQVNTSKQFNQEHQVKNKRSG